MGDEEKPARAALVGIDTGETQPNPGPDPGAVVVLKCLVVAVGKQVSRLGVFGSRCARKGWQVRGMRLRPGSKVGVGKKIKSPSEPGEGIGMGCGGGVRHGDTARTTMARQKLRVAARNAD